MELSSSLYPSSSLYIDRKLSSSPFTFFFKNWKEKYKPQSKHLVPTDKSLQHHECTIFVDLETKNYSQLILQYIYCFYINLPFFHLLLRPLK